MEPPTFEPGKQPLKAYAGMTFATLLRLWEDDAHTKPFSLEGYTVELVIVGVKTLTEGAGLTVVHKEGEITVVLSPTETAAIAGERSNNPPHYYVVITKAGVPTPIIRGTFSFEQP